MNSQCRELSGGFQDLWSKQDCGVLRVSREDSIKGATKSDCSMELTIFEIFITGVLEILRLMFIFYPVTFTIVPS